MRYAIAAILLLFSVAAFGQLDQFRMVGSGSWSVVDDSTYSATVTFASDLTANSFLPTGVVDSMRVFTQRGQLYTIDSVGAKTFSTAVIYAVEYGGDWGSPSGQVLVYETRGRETVPAIPFATNGATSKLQEAVVTHNAAINNGVSTTQLADSTTAAKTYTNNQIAAVAPVKDTIVQASHGFSVGDPIWYSGDYLLSLDTGLTVRVDGVVSAVPDINTFVLQRTGRFTFTSHGFTVGVQLYVQPDGSYSVTDTSNALVYGYPIDANTMQIGLKDDRIYAISNKFNNSTSGLSATTKEAAINEIDDRIDVDTSGLDSDSANINDVLRDVSINEQSNRRKFQTFDWFLTKKDILNINGQEVVNLPGESLYLSTAPDMLYKTEYNSDELTVDGFFLDTVNVDFTGANLLRFSRHLVNYPVEGDAPIVFNGTMLRNFAVGPDGKRKATGITQANSQTMFLDVVDVQPNTDYILSFYLKIHNNSSNFSIRNAALTGASQAPAVNVDTSRRDWVRYTVNLNQTASPPGTVSLQFFGIGATDTVIVDMFQLEEEPADGQPTAYKETIYGQTATSGRIYISRANQWIKNGSMYIPQGYVYQYYRRTGNDTEFIQSAIDYCAKNGRCNEVILPPGHFFTNSQINGKDGVFLKGSIEYRYPLGSTLNNDRVKYGTIIYANPSDSTENVFNFSPASGDQNINSSGLENIGIVIRDTIGTVLQITECTNCVFKNLSIEINSDDGSTHYNKGIVVGVTSGSDSYWNDFINIHVNDFDSVGIDYYGSTNNYWRTITAKSSDPSIGYGFRIAGGNHLYGEDFMLQSSGTSLSMEGQSGSNVHIKNLYTEGSGGGDGVIKMTGGVLKLSGGTLQTSTTTDTLYNITGGESFTVEESEVRNGGVIKIENIDQVNFNHVGTSIPLAEYFQDSQIGKSINIYRNYNITTGLVYDNKLNLNDQYNSSLIESGVRNSTLVDTFKISRNVLTGVEHNFIPVSDTFEIGNQFFGAATDTIKVFRNAGAITPFGDTAHVITYQGSDIGGQSIDWFTTGMTALGSETEYYTFSVYLYNHSASWLRTPFMKIRPGSLDNDVDMYVNLPPRQWIRKSVRGKYLTNASGLTLRLLQPSGISSTDSISISHMQIEPGPIMTTYIETSGVLVNTNNVEVVVIDQDSSLKIIGGLEVTGNLISEKYRTFTPIIFDNVDTLLVDRLELGFESLKITDEIDGLQVKQVTFTTDRNVTADTGVRLEYFDISASSYTSFGSGTIVNGTNRITVTGLTKPVEVGDMIYVEVVSSGGEANGISATVKFQ